jgi:hypothetical protein
VAGRSRRRRAARAAGAAAVVALGLPSGAGAATVHVGTAPEARFAPYGSYAESEAVFYVAAPGERNRLLVAYARDALSVTVTDPGAVVEAGESCVSIDAHTARCRARPDPVGTGPHLQHAEADLGDLDDELRTDRPTPYPIGGVAARGGPGDDLLDGGAGPDELDGGGGRDVLLGGAHGDVLSDGDLSGAEGPLGPASDLMDGGPGRDLVAYAQRTAGVDVDIADARPDGEPGEGDVVRAVEDVAGGEGSDRLRGDGRANLILGGGGADLLVGRDNPPSRLRSNDQLIGGDGDDRLVGGDGADFLEGGPGLDALSCGPGADTVGDPAGGELVEPLCEEVVFFISEDDSFALDPYPYVRSRRAVALRFECPTYELDDGEFFPCHGRILVREAAGARRVLGFGRVSVRRASPPARARVALTALGRRLARRPGGVAATFSVRGYRLPRVAWTIALRTPR